MSTQHNDGGPAVRRYLVFNIGCIECGVSSAIVGTFDTEAEATRVADACNDDPSLSWRNGGQNSYEVFDLHADPSPEYADAMLRAREAR